MRICSGELSGFGSALGGGITTDIFESVFSSKKIPPNGSNRGHYRNSKLDALLDQARVEMDQEKRKRCFGRFRRSWPRMSLISICGIGQCMRSSREVDEYRDSACW
jgi:hypothetical protein